MLSGESAIGSYGEKALSVLRMVSGRMELQNREENRRNALHQCHLGDSLLDCISEEICNSAVEMGIDFSLMHCLGCIIYKVPARNVCSSPMIEQLINLVKTFGSLFLQAKRKKKKKRIYSIYLLVFIFEDSLWRTDEVDW